MFTRLMDRFMARLIALVFATMYQHETKKEYQGKKQWIIKLQQKGC
jgi:hypothetical protein